MPSNTTNLEGYTVYSSVSLNGSGATLKAKDIVVGSTLSVGGTVTLSATTLTVNAVLVGSGAALGPTLAPSSEVSLGLYRSGASVLALSYGTFDTSAGGLAFKTLAGKSAWTAGSSGTTLTIADGQFQFSILSNTTNGGTIRYRSGNTIYTFASVSN